MKRFYFLTIHPAIIDTYTSVGIFNSARKQKCLDTKSVNLREYAVDEHGSIDDRPYGGGDGMVMRPEPLEAALKSLPSKQPLVILPSPSGAPFKQKDAEFLASLDRDLVFACGRFGGIDQRFIDQYVELEISLGDYIISGGELASLSIADAIVRHLPGALGNAESSKVDSFSDHFEGGLEGPVYTRPASFNGQAVPDILMSGDHEKIRAWRMKVSKHWTATRRPGLLPK